MTSAPPFPIALSVENIPAQLREQPRWIAWRGTVRDGEPTKQPVDPRNGRSIDPTAPTLWRSFEEVVPAIRGRGLGLGFVFGPDDPFAGVDLDDCRDVATGVIAPWALEIIAAFDTYAEVSPSGTGVKLFLRGSLPPGGNRKGSIEMYDRGRYFTVTGQHLPGTPMTVNERGAALSALHEQVFGAPSHDLPASVTSLPTNDDDDEALIERARRAANGDKFARLWGGDTGGHDGDDSIADLALGSLIAFWTGPDPARIDRLFRRSGLMREKWDRRPDYRERTIRAALAGRTEFWSPHGVQSPSLGLAAPGIAEAAWEPPLPLYAHQLPTFPVAAFPDWLRDFVAAEAEATQTPPDLAGMLALTALAVAGAGRAVVQPRAGWPEPLNLYTAVVLPPASRKSPVFKDMVEPIRAYEKELVAAARPGIATARAERDIKEATLKRAKDEAAKAGAGQGYDTARDQVGLITRELLVPLPVEPRLLVDDATPEKLGELLGAQGGRLAALAPEGGIFAMMSGRYSKGIANLDTYLRAHAAEELRVDRLNRPSDYVAAATLTIGATMQPHVLRGLGDGGALRGQGLLARFLYSLPPDIIGERSTNPAPMPAALHAEYRARLLGLLALTPATDSAGEPAPHILRFDPLAQERWGRFEAWVESQLRPLGKLGTMREWGGKFAGHVARIVGLLHLARFDGRSSPWGHQIDADTLDAAITVGDYLLAHAGAAFAAIGSDPMLEGAQHLLRWIEHHGEVSFSKRAIYDANRARFPTVADIEKPVALLVAYGYLRRSDPIKGQPGRPPSPTFFVNPLFLASCAGCAGCAGPPGGADDGWEAL